MKARSITGLVLAALLTVPAAAQAQSRSGTGVWLGGALGLETGDNFSGLKLRAEAEIPVLRLAPTVQLYGVGAVSYARLSHSTNLFTAMPAVRVNWAASREVGAYGDVGLGIYHEDNGHNTGATMRFLVGAYYEMTPSARFFADAGLNPYFGDFGGKNSLTSFTLLIGGKFRI